jgi:hypothetical protein
MSSEPLISIPRLQYAMVLRDMPDQLYLGILYLLPRMGNLGPGKLEIIIANRLLTPSSNSAKILFLNPVSHVAIPPSTPD